MSEDLTQEAAFSERLRLWLEGTRPALGVHDALVVGALSDEAMTSLPGSEESLLFVEESQVEAAQALTRSRVVGYNGEFSTNGGEIGIGTNFVVQLEGYATAPYVAISCPTAFSIEEDADREAVAADAATAFETGVFPRFLLTQLVTIVDQEFWHRCGQLGSDPARLFVPAGSSLMLSGPAGGGVEINDGAYTTHSPVAGEENAKMLSENSGIGRFLGAAKVLRAAQSRFPADARISGFGSSLVDGDPAAERSRRDSVFVIVADEQYFVTELRTGRLNKVPKDVAQAVETILSGVELGAELQGRLGLKLSGKDLAPSAQIARSKELQMLFSHLGIDVSPGMDAVAPPAVAVPVNPALTIVPVIIT
ncbi:hypothetical protein [Arthrobacter sp. efr-133-TYG-104]|uniref:hypothetical protein n=1 Tax=Arthrobacter sp. efr-133-TYG-104 TaxID=3040324 RepID=UPI00254E61A5|nr:hypothetical protein [Arthrobacter sp. efr-133-TYG-104]